MRDTFFQFWAGVPRAGGANCPRFDRLTYVGKSAGHRLAPSADLSKLKAGLVDLPFFG